MRMWWTGIALLATAWAGAQSSLAVSSYRALAAEVQSANLRDDIRTIGSFGNRLAGSPGERRTLDWVAQRLAALGCISIERQPFKVATPDPNSKSILTVGAKSFELHPLWPNLVSPSTCSLSRVPIIDGSSPDGYRVAGSIAILPFESGAEWRRLVRLGAKAIVFTSTGAGVRRQAELKMADAPINVPRFLFQGPETTLLAAVGQLANLSCRQNWLTSESSNLIAVLPGASSEEALIGAFADSASLVPGLNPGAQSSMGLATLLETVRVLGSQSRRRSLRIVVFGAHFLGLKGAREYVMGWGDRPPVVAGLTLDLSSGSPTLGIFGRGWMIDSRDESKDFVRTFARFIRERAQDAGGVASADDPTGFLYDGVNDFGGRPWKHAIPGPAAFDAEPFVLGQVPVLTLATTEDVRSSFDTPWDTTDRVDPAIHLVQTRRAAGIVLDLANLPLLVRSASNAALGTRPSKPRMLSLVGGLGTVSGQVVRFDPRKSIVPNTPVPGALTFVLGRKQHLMGVRGDMVEIADDQGRYQFAGLPLANSYLERDRQPLQVGAFALDETGSVALAPSEGISGAADFPTRFSLTTTSRTSPIVAFPCRAVDVTGIYDPQTFKPMSTFSLLDPKTQGPPTQYGLFHRTNRSGTGADVSAFLPIGSSCLLVGRGKEGDIRFVDSADTTSLSNRLLAESSAASLIGLATKRISDLAPHRIVPAEAERFLERAVAASSDAERAAAEQKWGPAERAATASWGFALRAYPLASGIAADVTLGVLFYLFLLVPFSYFAERLLLGSRKLGVQIAVGIAIFALSFWALKVLHPAFAIIQNPWIVFIGFVMAGLSLFVTIFIVAKFDRSLSDSGPSGSVPTTDMKRAGAVAVAFQVGVAGMRRRPLRTGLTTLTLVLMTFIVLSFTSLVPTIEVRTQPTDRKASYAGILVRDPELAPLSPGAREALSVEFGSVAKLACRTSYEGGEPSAIASLTVRAGLRRKDFRSVLGVDAEDPLLKGDLLAAGRWPRLKERGVCALPVEIAQALAIDVGGSLRFAGIERRLIGIYDSSKVEALRDLDGDGLLPADFNLSREKRQYAGKSAAFLSFPRVPGSACIVLPTEDVLDLGGHVRSIAVTGAGADLTDLMPRLRINLYASNARGMVEQHSAMPSARGVGFGMVLVQMLIAGVFVFNTMIAGVYERRTEIGILSSIGMAPNHVGALFFAESLIYGIIGSVLGYLGAQTCAKALSATQALPSLQLNFSSTSAVTSVFAVLAVVLLSTVYPARAAAALAEGSGEAVRSTLPQGDAWSIDLPFMVAANEVEAVLEHFGKWFQAHESYSLGAFVTEGVAVSGKALGGTAWLAPFDLGVSQRFDVVPVEFGQSGLFAFRIELGRLSGEPKNWIRVNERFLDAIRTQFLAWRTQG